MKKRLGISFTKTKFQNYWNWFTPADLQQDIELVELSFEKKNNQDIATCHAFILTGGIDIDPDLYSGLKDYINKPDAFQTERDRFEEHIFNYAQQHTLPVLGICRGLQLVNVLQSGKLIQDLGTANETHRATTEGDKQHTVTIERNTLLNNIVFANTGNTNSAHHQAIHPQFLGNNLMVNARSGSNNEIIEGIEFKDKTNKAFMLCVQWHPERMADKEENPLSYKIKEYFLQAIRK